MSLVPPGYPLSLHPFHPVKNDVTLTAIGFGAPLASTVDDVDGSDDRGNRGEGSRELPPNP